MQVKNPEECANSNEIVCRHCPFTDGNGRMESGAMVKLCDDWNESHDLTCPTLATYAEACDAARFA